MLGRFVPLLPGLILLTGCAADAGSSPTASSTARPSASPTPVVTPIALSDTMITAPETEPFLLLQGAGDARLRGVAWDGSVSGLFTQAGPFGLSSQSPDGRFAVLGGTVFDRHGREFGPFPWPGKDMSATWSPDSSVMCRTVPAAQVTGSAMRLQVASPGKAPRTVAEGYATYSDNASFPVLACDPTRDRAIVGELGQGIAPVAVWVIRLSTNTVVRSITAPGDEVAASSDALLLARSSIPLAAGQTPTTSIERADDGAILGSVPNMEAHGFSGENSLVVGISGSKRTPVVVNWQTRRRVWTAATGSWFGYLAEPAGTRVVIGLTTTDGNLDSAFLVGADGAARLLPQRISVALLY